MTEPPVRCAPSEPRRPASCPLAVDVMMAAFRTVSSYFHGATQSELALREYKERHGWSSGAETRRALAPQMNYLMSAGRYPNYQRYGLGAAHKDDPTWEFDLGLDCILDGITARLGV
ncbi:hypothetical protein ACWFRM_22135 [Streptomyces sp. NPDC055144]